MAQKLSAFVLVVGLVIGSYGPFLFITKVAQAADTSAPGMMHWGISMVEGSASASTSVSVFATAGDDQAQPSAGLTVTATYRTVGGNWSSSNCSPVESGARLFQCDMNVDGGTDLRTFEYYLKACDGPNSFFLSYASVTNATTSAEADPFQATVYNSPSWNNGISGQYSSSDTSSFAVAGVKDNRCTSLTAPASAGATTLYVDASSADSTGLGLTPNQWIDVDYINEKFKILSTTTDASDMVITLSGPISSDVSSGYCINEFIAGATVWIDGTTIYSTTSAEQATTTFGTFNLPNVPDGSWEAAAFKEGYMDSRQMGISLYGGSTTTIDFFLSYGDFQGGGDMTGANVIWSAPMDNMMGAPLDIGITSYPMIIGLSENASSGTITTSNVLLKKVNQDQTSSLVSGYSVAYEPMGQSVTINSQQYDFGPDANIIIYSSTALATSSNYTIQLTSNVKDAQQNSISGNDPAGGHSIFFGTTGGDFSEGFDSGDFAQGGSYMPPFVMGVLPQPGRKNVGQNTKIILEFDQAMTSNSTNLSTYIQLWTLDSTFGLSSQVSISSALSRSDSQRIIITPASNLSAGMYRVIANGGLQSSSGMSLGPPDMSTQRFFESEFEVGASADTTQPTIVGSSLDRYLSSGVYTNVPTAGAFKTSFSEAIDPDTISTNSINLKVKGSTTELTGTASYDLMEGKAIFLPASALNASSTYILTLESGINDLSKNDNELATTTYEFTTGSMDDVNPNLQFFNADDYQIALTFNEPMNSASITNTNVWPSGKTKWETSVLNPANYVVYVDNGPPPSASTALYFGCANLAGTTTACTTRGTSGLTFSYDALYNTLEVQGLMLNDPEVGLSVANGLRVWVNNVTDLSGNTINGSNAVTPPNNFGNNSMGGPFFSSMDTFGMIGPGGGMMGPPPSSGSFSVTDFGGKDPAMMGMMPVGVWPMNMVAGAKSMYMVDIPISTGMAIEAGGKIILGPFPEEANVAGAMNADANAQFAHYDINGPGTGKVVIGTATENSGGASNDGVTVSGQTVTITVGAVATQAPDFIHFELDGIYNPTSPTQGGYKINIQTQNSTGRQLESFTSMPFFIQPKGKYYVVGQVHSGGTGLNNVDVFGGSPMSGPLYTTTANNAYGSSTDGEFQIDGLNQGNVMLMTEPSVTVGGDEYVAPMPEDIYLNDTTTADSAADAEAGNLGCTSDSACYYYKQFALTQMATATTPGLTVRIFGNFASGGVGSNDIDIFAGGSNGFRVKTITLNSDHSSTPNSTSFFLPATGEFHIGIGPAMPKGPMGMGAPPMPDNWMPPKDTFIEVSGSGGSWNWTENSGTANDGVIDFTIEIADKTINGHVYDPSGTAVSNAEVFAYSPTEHFGTNRHVAQDGSFTLNVKEGFYKVGAFLPGAPPSNEVGVNVKSDGSVYAEGALATDLILKLSKNISSGYTISGTVYSDSASNYPASNASVYAYRTDGPGHSETMTDSKGTYTLYVGSGAWNVGVFLPDYGDLSEQTVTVAPSKSGLNFAPSADTTYITIRERIWEDDNANGSYDDGEGVSRASVAVISTSIDYVNTATTDTNGIYEVKVLPSTVYDVEAWSPDIGNLPPIKNVAATTTDIIYTTYPGVFDIKAENATTVEFTFYDNDLNPTTTDKVLVQFDQLGAEGINNDVYKENTATTTINVPTSATNDYLIDIEVQGVPKDMLNIVPFDSNSEFGSTTVGSNMFATTTVDDYEKFKVILPEMCNVRGQVLDDSGDPVPGAMVHIEQPGKDVEFNVEADSSGNYSFRVASTTTAYLVQVDKNGYVDSAVSVYASTTSMTFNPEVEEAGYSISGTITLNGSAPDTSTYVWAEKLGGGFGSTAQADSSTGAYTLTVPNGDWEVSATVEGYAKSTKTTIAYVGDANVTGVDLNITSSMLSSLQKQETIGMTGNVGGSIMNKDAGFAMNIPSSTLSASDSSSYNVKEKEITNIPEFTSTGNLVGDKAEEVSAYTMSGSNGGVSTVSSLNGSAFIDKTFTIAELAAENIDTVAEIEQTKLSSYENNNWNNLPTTISYLDTNEQPVVPSADLSNVDKVIFNGVTTHFSTFGVVNTTFDGLAPAAPTNVAVANQSNYITVTWDDVTTNSDGTTASDITSYNVWRATSGDSTAVWQKITSVIPGIGRYDDYVPDLNTNYSYKITADSGLQSSFSSVVGGGATGVVASSGGSTGGFGGYSVSDDTSDDTADDTTTDATTTAETTTETTAETTTETTADTTTETTATETTQPAIAGVPSSFTFSLKLKLGSIGDAVKYMQIVLNSDPDTRLAETGVGSPGNETNYFGPLTKQAVIRFQEKYKAKVLGPWGLTNGTGLVGSTTREKLNELIQQVISSDMPAETTDDTSAGETLSVSGISSGFKFVLKLKLKSTGDEVKNLQILLNADPDTRLAETGVGSPGNETNYFGPLTKQAVIRFQEKYKSAVLGPWGLANGTGLVGSTTREKLNELLGQ